MKHHQLMNPLQSPESEGMGSDPANR